MSTPSIGPEHDKLAEVLTRSWAIGEFLEWCEGQSWYLVQWIDDAPSYLLANEKIRIDLLARFFGIDLVKLLAEKTDMIERLRQAHIS